MLRSGDTFRHALDFPHRRTSIAWTRPPTVVLGVIRLRDIVRRKNDYYNESLLRITPIVNHVNVVGDCFLRVQARDPRKSRTDCLPGARHREDPDTAVALHLGHEPKLIHLAQTVSMAQNSSLPEIKTDRTF